MGFFCEQGVGGANKEDALGWYCKAAEQENASAQYKLGVFYENGYGVTQNKEEAAKWYKKAADQGDENAKKAIDKMQSSGLGSAAAAAAALAGVGLVWKILKG